MITVSAYALGQILNWFQRLIIFYSLGENELPNEYRILLSRYRLNDIHEVDKLILLKYANINNVIDSYDFKITEPHDMFFPSKPSSVSVRFVIVDSPVAEIVSRGNTITIFVDKDILSVTNLIESVITINILVGDLGLYIDTFPFFNVVDLEDISVNIISYYFIKSIFNNIDWSKIVDESDQSTTLARDFVIEKTDNIKSFEDLISKVINEDDEVWSYFVKALS